MDDRRWIPYLARVFALAGLYFAGAKLGQAFSLGLVQRLRLGSYAMVVPPKGRPIKRSRKLPLPFLSERYLLLYSRLSETEGF